jgi:hypothetical protein
MSRSVNSKWLSVVLLALLVCGCASLGTDNSAHGSWDDHTRYSTPEDWGMKPVLEPPSYGP